MTIHKVGDQKLQYGINREAGRYQLYRQVKLIT